MVWCKYIASFFLLFLVQLTPIYAQIEEPASYIGGNMQLNMDIRRYLQYPEDAKNRGIQGTVIVQFKLDSLGAVHDVKVLEGIIPSMDSAAVQLIKFLNNWKPAKINGVPVHSTLKLPIRFLLFNGSNNNREDNEILIKIKEIQSKITQYLSQDSLDHIRNILKDLNNKEFNQFYQIADFDDYVLLHLITGDFDGALFLIKDFKNYESPKLTASNIHSLSQAIDIYLRSNYAKIEMQIDPGNMSIDEKNLLRLFVKNDQLKRYPDKNKSVFIHGYLFDKTYIEKSSKLGYKYLKYAIDTSYNDYVRKIIVAEKRYKYLSGGLGLGYGNMLHNKNNHNIYSNPQGLIVHYDLYYKNLFSTMVIGILNCRNFETVKIDTFNLKPKTKLGNNMVQFGLGYRFFISDLIHLVPYLSYNIINVSYTHEVTEDKSITKSKALDRNFAQGIAINYSFTKNNSGNYKPANYTPLGLSFRYGFMIDKQSNKLNSISHFFSLTFSILFVLPKRNDINQNYFMYR